MSRASAFRSFSSPHLPRRRGGSGRRYLHDRLSHDRGGRSRLSFIILFHRSRISIWWHRALPFIHATRAPRRRPRLVAWAPVLAAPRRDGSSLAGPFGTRSEPIDLSRWSRLRARRRGRSRRLCRRLISIRSALIRVRRAAASSLGKPVRHAARARRRQPAGDPSEPPERPRQFGRPRHRGVVCRCRIVFFLLYGSMSFARNFEV